MNTPKHKIGFCFLIKDQLHNQSIWKQFFNNIPHDEYKIYIHYKTKCDISLQNYEFIDSIPTEWGSISLVKATFLLFKRAVADNCTIMFLLSGDTLPMQPYSRMRTIKHTIIRPMSFNPVAKTPFCIKSYSRLSSPMQKNIPVQHWRKQHMFFCMTANHFAIIASQPKLHHYSKVCIPDEYYFINQCTYLKIPFVSDKYIYVGQTNHKTQALDITNDMFRTNKDDIKQFLFIRKIVNCNAVPDYMSFIQTLFDRGGTHL
jgi:hypothetical protein